MNTYESELYVRVRGLVLIIDICWNNDYYIRLLDCIDTCGACTIGIMSWI